MVSIKTVNDVAEQTKAGSQNNLIMNAVENQKKIAEMFLKSRPDLAILTQQIPPNTPALIIGSGASLDDYIEQIRGWRGIVFATAQTFAPLMARGIVPQFITCVDTSIDDVIPLRGEGNVYTTMITHPSIHPEMLEAWKGPILFATVSFDDETDALTRAMYPFITFNMGAQGCVSNMQLIICKVLQCKPVVLIGMDMQTTDGRSSATRWRKVGNWRWEAIPNPRSEEKGVQIPLVMQFYRLLMAVIWKTSYQQIFRVGRGLDLIPEISIEDALAQKWPKYPEHHELVKLIDAYTIPEGVYGAMSEGKPTMIEFAEHLTKNPKNDIEREAGKHWEKLPDGKWRRS